MLKFAARKRNRPRIHLTALIDIVFLLLIFFLLASRFVEQTGVTIMVPETSNVGLGLLPEVIVQVDHRGTIYIDEIDVTPAQLTFILEQRLKSQNKDTVIIQADRRVIYDIVVQTIDAAKLAGAKTLVLVTKHKP